MKYNWINFNIPGRNKSGKLNTIDNIRLNIKKEFSTLNTPIVHFEINDNTLK